jgi:hypothetical protein
MREENDFFAIYRGGFPSEVTARCQYVPKCRRTEPSRKPEWTTTAAIAIAENTLVGG